MSVSFRDPAGQLLNVNGRIIRIINNSGIDELKTFLASKTAQTFLEKRLLPQTNFLDSQKVESLREDFDFERTFQNSNAQLVVEHERIPFASFPFEWTPEMLYQAGVLTLDLAESLLTEGLGLKDASPYNVLFRGSQPVFIDLLSFEQRDARDPTWLPYAQFIRTFVLPLLVNQRFDLRLDQLLINDRDGLEPEAVYRLCSSVQKLTPPFLTLASLPTWLAKKNKVGDKEIYQKNLLDNSEKSRFILEHLFKRLHRNLQQVAPLKRKQSGWSGYMDCNESLSPEYLSEKDFFVTEALSEIKPLWVLDVGCNTGHFSHLAARQGARVVAIDRDATVVGETWRTAHAQHLDVLPLVVDITRPTPSIGWRNTESPSFLERAHGRFDCVLMLALIHHLVITERIPLAEIFSLAAELTKDALIVEFIVPDDPMFQLLVRGRESLFTYLTQDFFEDSAQRYFNIQRRQATPRTTRQLYLMRKKDAAGSC